MLKGHRVSHYENSLSGLSLMGAVFIQTGLHR